MKGTCRLVRTRSETYSTHAEGRPASRRLCRVFHVRFYFPRNPPGVGKLFNALLGGGDVIVIAPIEPSLTCETSSATFAPWQKRTSPLGAHPAGPSHPVAARLS